MSKLENIRRGRKRLQDDCSEEEEKKRQKNRDAAKRCRERKVKQAENLRERNTELERKNMELTKAKCALEEEVRKLSRIIVDHKALGCTLPDEIESMLDHVISSDDEDYQQDSEASSDVPPGPNGQTISVSSSPSHDNIGDLSQGLFSGAPVVQRMMPVSQCVENSPQMSSLSKVPIPVNGGFNLVDYLSKCKAAPNSGPLAPIQARRNSNFSQFSDSNNSSSNLGLSAAHQDMNLATSSELCNASLNSMTQNALQRSRFEPSILPEVVKSSTSYDIDSGNRYANVQTSLPIVVTEEDDNDEESTDNSFDQSCDSKVVVKEVNNEPMDGYLNISTAEMMAPALLSMDPSQMPLDFQQQIIKNVSQTTSTYPSSSQPSSPLLQVSNISSDHIKISPSKDEPFNGSLHTSTESQINSVELHQKADKQSSGLVSQEQIYESTTIGNEISPSQIYEIINQYTREMPLVTESEQSAGRPIILSRDGIIILLKPQPDGTHLIYKQEGDQYKILNMNAVNLRNIKNQSNNKLQPLQQASLPSTIYQSHPPINNKSCNIPNIVQQSEANIPNIVDEVHEID